MPFHDGEPTGIEYSSAEEPALRAALVEHGICRPATETDFPGADVTDRLAVIGWVPPEPGSLEHKAAALELGHRLAGRLAGGLTDWQDRLAEPTGRAEQSGHA